MKTLLRVELLAAAMILLQACSGGDNSPPAAAAPQVPANTPATQPPQDAATAEDASPAQETGFSSARVFIVSPVDGATLVSPVTVVFGIENFELAPAGTFAPKTGHHHLLIDTDLPSLNQPIPADANHMHFGKGQTEATIELPPGQHTLQLLLGDGYHVPHDPALISPPITITITEAGAEAVE